LRGTKIFTEFLDNIGKNLLPEVLPIKEVKMQAYCVKCRKKVEVKNPQSIIMKNKRPATKGECPNCGTKVFRIGKA
jgi:Zn finger protein HypA/HybF involved in hydrogenase expression